MTLLAEVRAATGVSQSQWAHAAGTSRPTLSAYENGRKSPTLDTAQRLLAALGWELRAIPAMRWRMVEGPRGRSAWVPSELPRLSPGRALRRVELPLALNWTQPGRVFDLSDRADRARAYEMALREGEPQDIADVVDGILLVDLWDAIVVPAFIRRAWAPLAEAALGDG